MVGIPGGGGGSRVDYTGPAEPANPEVNEVWLDTDADPDGDGTAQGAYKRYGSDGEWHLTSVDDHNELKGVLADSHHAWPIPTSGIADSAVTAAKVAFDYVTPTEFNSHTSDETNPHNVDDSQTGAASALSTHAGQSGAHHSRPTSTATADAAGVRGRESTFRRPFHASGSVSDQGGVTESRFTYINATTDEIRIERDSGTSVDATIYYQDGSTKTVSLPGSSNAWYGTDPGKEVSVVGHTGAVYVTGLNPVAATSHDHNV